MAGHLDILEQEDSLRQPFFGSLMVHAGIAALVAGAMFFQETPYKMGDPNAQGGGSTVITPVSSIEMPSRTQRVQPVANDTESMVPERVKPIKPPPEDPNAIPIGKKKEEPKKKVNFDLKKYLEARKEARDREPNPSNIGSSTGERASSPMFTQKPGAGGVGTPSGLLGEGFGAYEQYLRTCISRNWKTGDVDGGIRTAPDVTVSFRIPREGVASDIHVIKSSGNARLDNSGLRAIEACNPFNPLPAGFPKSSALIEIVFRLQR